MGSKDKTESLGVDEVMRLAGLARLNLSTEEAAPIAHDLDRLLEMFKQLQLVDTEEVEPLSHVHGETNRYREDAAAESPLREKILEQAPEKSGTFLKVPLVIDQIDNL